MYLMYVFHLFRVNYNLFIYVYVHCVLNSASQKKNETENYRYLVTSLQIVFNHSCVKYALYELHEMKEEGLSFTNVCNLLIIIVIKL